MGQVNLQADRFLPCLPYWCHEYLGNIQKILYFMLYLKLFQVSFNKAWLSRVLQYFVVQSSWVLAFLLRRFIVHEDTGIGAWM